MSQLNSQVGQVPSCVCAFARVLSGTQSCLTLCDAMDCSLPGSSVHGILYTRILEWVACPPPGDLPSSEIEPRSSSLQVDSLLSEPPGEPFRYTRLIF